MSEWVEALVLVVVAALSYYAGRRDGFEDGYRDCLWYQSLFRRRT